MDEKGKEAKTDFELIQYIEDKNQSIVRAFPKTGRTHQIRVHLQVCASQPICLIGIKFAGYPIVNDMLYNHHAFGVERFESMKQKKIDLDEFHKELAKSRGWNEHGFKSGEKLESNDVRDPLCPKCNENPADPIAEDLVLFLHCHRYTGPDWSFESEMPDWSEPDFDVPQFYDKYLKDMP